MICECGPDFFLSFSSFCVQSIFFNVFAGLVSGVDFVEICFLLLFFVLFPILFVFLRI